MKDLSVIDTSEMELSVDEIYIAKVQMLLKKFRYQYQEQIFNDGAKYDCLVMITKNRDPEFFADYRDCTGWGRAPRINVWTEVYRYLIGQYI
jgi:hypothetical protein